MAKNGDLDLAVDTLSSQRTYNKCSATTTR